MYHLISIQVKVYQNILLDTDITFAEDLPVGDQGFKFESELFKGTAFFRVKGIPANDLYFKGKHRTLSLVCKMMKYER